MDFNDARVGSSLLCGRGRRYEGMRMLGVGLGLRRRRKDKPLPGFLLRCWGEGTWE